MRHLRDINLAALKGTCPHSYFNLIIINRVVEVELNKELRVGTLRPETSPLEKTG